MPERKRINENKQQQRLLETRQQSLVSLVEPIDRNRQPAAREARANSRPATATATAASLERAGANHSAANVIMQPQAGETTIQSAAAQGATRIETICTTRAEESRAEIETKSDPNSKLKPRQLTARHLLATQADASCPKWTPFAGMRRAGPSLAPAMLLGLYCLLATCALVARCAPTGSQRLKANEQQPRQQQQEQLAEDRPTTMKRPSESARPDEDLVGLLNVKPIGILLTGTQNQHHPKFTSEQYDSRPQRQQQQRRRSREEANISSESSLESALSLARKQPSRGDTKAAADGSGGGGDHDEVDDYEEDERQILLVLARDSAPSPSALRRLSKRSGISDQRLAEIQMIRALKKQLERAAAKIDTDSTGDGDNEAGQTSPAGGETAGA